MTTPRDVLALAGHHPCVWGVQEATLQACKGIERAPFAVEAFPILGQSAAAAKPGEGAFDDPALGQDDEAFGVTQSLDDLEVGSWSADERPLTKGA